MKRVVSTKLWDDDCERLKEIAGEEGITVSELLRMIIYDFLKNPGLKNELEEVRKRAEMKCDDLGEVRGLLGRISNYTNQMAKSLDRTVKMNLITKDEQKKVNQVIGELLSACMSLENWINKRY